jgi:hypothetical protein
VYHPMHLGNVDAAVIYRSLAIADVDDRMGTGKRKFDFSEHSALKVMGDAIVKVWGGSKTEDFVWKEV